MKLLYILISLLFIVACDSGVSSKASHDNASIQKPGKNIAPPQMQPKMAKKSVSKDSTIAVEPNAKFENANIATNESFADGVPMEDAVEDMDTAGAGGDMGEAAEENDADIASELANVDPEPELKKEKKPTIEEKETTLYLSADDSNSQASPIVVRSRILQGRYVDPSVIRTYEFLNYYTFDYPAAKQNSIAIYPEMQKEESGEYSLQVAVRAENRQRNAMIPVNFTFLIDVSGSMAGQSMLLAKSFFDKCSQVLQKGDRFSVVVCNRNATVVVDSLQIGKGNIEVAMRKVMAALQPDDITNLHQGIVKAYELAEKNYIDEFLNRVVLISDGAANAGKLSIDAIKKHAQDSQRKGIYLVGVGLGEGFHDGLMNAFTDAGKGAYFFIADQSDIDLALGKNFVSNFDLAVKDVRLKMVMPAGWQMVKFHGEQVSTVASEVIPQYLSPNDQMIYSQVLKTSRNMTAATRQSFAFEAEFVDAATNQKKTISTAATVSDMLQQQYKQIEKGNAVVAFAEMFTQFQTPYGKNKKQNLEIITKTRKQIEKAVTHLQDEELKQILKLIDSYSNTIENGEMLRSLDKNSSEIAHVLGLSSGVKQASITGANPRTAIQVASQLGNSTQLAPREGYKFLLISSGPIDNNTKKGGGKISSLQYDDPHPEYMGKQKTGQQKKVRIHDLHQVTLTLTAPKNAKSFSFDFNFFSAEYPEYVNQRFNDTFYAIIEATSTNQGAKTNIAFDSNNGSIEVDNNYFQNPFHPISNRGTGFGNSGSTSWLRTSWPIQGGETFKITFSVHDEGDEIYDSLVVLDNFQWHEYESVGTTDPLN